MLERELTTVLSKEAAKPFIEHLGMQTIGDLLWHLPRRHYRRGDLTDFADIEVGEFVTLAARITNVASHTSYPRGKALQRTIVTISDGRRSLDLVFFNLKRFQLAKLVKGESGMFSGTVNRFNSKLQLQHPEWELFDDLDDSQQNAWVSGLVPVYPATKKVSSLSIRKAVRTVLERVDLAEVTDAVPQHVRESHGLMRFGEALGAYHVAESDERLEEAKRALKWHEALQLQASLVVMREFTRRLASTARPAGALLAEFDSRLPFDLTPDQHQIGDQIAADLDRQHPMHRLVQGEVGSGKTMVALRAMLQVAETGGQSSCWRRPRCWPRSTSGRSSTPSGQSSLPGSTRCSSRGSSQWPSASAAPSPQPAASRSSRSEPMRSSARRRPSQTWASSSSMSSIASASASARRCAVRASSRTRCCSPPRRFRARSR